MGHMENIKRVEIIIPQPELEAVLLLLEKAQVEGYTVIEKARGKGQRGVQDARGLTDAFSNALIIWYCRPADFEALEENLRRVLNEAGGVCGVSEAQWIAH